MMALKKETALSKFINSLNDSIYILSPFLTVRDEIVLIRLPLYLKSLPEN